MKKTAVVLLLALLAVPAHAQESAPQDPAGAYKACLVGNSVVALLQEDFDGADAYFRAAAICEYLEAAVPNDGTEFSGPSGVQEEVIHLWDNQLVDLLLPVEAEVAAAEARRAAAIQGQPTPAN